MSPFRTEIAVDRQLPTPIAELYGPLVRSAGPAPRTLDHALRLLDTTVHYVGAVLLSAYERASQEVPRIEASREALMKNPASAANWCSLIEEIVYAVADGRSAVSNYASIAPAVLDSLLSLLADPALVAFEETALRAAQATEQAGLKAEGGRPETLIGFVGLYRRICSRKDGAHALLGSELDLPLAEKARDAALSFVFGLPWLPEARLFVLRNVSKTDDGYFANRGDLFRGSSPQYGHSLKLSEPLQDLDQVALVTRDDALPLHPYLLCADCPGQLCKGRPRIQLLTGFDAESVNSPVSRHVWCGEKNVAVGASSESSSARGRVPSSPGDSSVPSGPSFLVDYVVVSETLFVGEKFELQVRVRNLSEFPALNVSVRVPSPRGGTVVTERVPAAREIGPYSEHVFRFACVAGSSPSFELGPPEVVIGHRGHEQASASDAPRYFRKSIAFRQSLPMVGRQGEIEALSGEYELARSGKWRNVIIAGPSGVGKTRLCEEFTQTILDDDSLVLGADSEFPSDAMLGPVLGLLYTYLNRYCDGRRANQSLALSASAAEIDSAGGLFLSHVLDALESELDIEPLESPLSITPAPIEETGEPPFLPAKQRLLDRIVRVFKGICTTGPLVLLVDDAQQIHEDTWSVLRRLVLNLRKERVLLILSVQTRPGQDLPEHVDDFLEFSGAEYRRLPLLGKDDLSALFDRLLPGNSLSSQVKTDIVDFVGGYPLRLYTIIKHSYTNGLINWDRNSGWTSASKDSSGFLKSLKEIVRHDIDGLRQDLRSTLYRAACHGRKFPVFASTADDDVYQRLLVLRDRYNLVRPVSSDLFSGRDWEFIHKETYEYIYESIPDFPKQQLHHDIALELEKSGASRTDKDVIDHLREARQYDSLVERLEKRATDHKDPRHQSFNSAIADLEECYRHYQERKVSRDDEWALDNRSEVSRLLWFDGKLELSTRVGEEAVALAIKAESLPGEIDLRRQLAGRYIALNRWDDAYTHASQLHKLATAQQSREMEHKASLLLGTVSLGRGPRFYDDCETRLSEVEAYALENGDRALEGDCSRHLGILYRRKGDFDRSEACFNRAMEAYYHLSGKDRIYGQARTSFNLASLYADTNRLDEAEKLVGERLCTSCRHLYDRKLEGRAAFIRAKIAFQRKDLKKATELNKASLEIKQEVGDLAGEARSHDLFAALYFGGEQHQKAAEEFDAAYKKYLETKLYWLADWNRLKFARFWLHRKEEGKAREILAAGFRAEDTWNSFMEKELNAIQGVLEGRPDRPSLTSIKFEDQSGVFPLSQVLPPPQANPDETDQSPPHERPSQNSPDRLPTPANSRRLSPLAKAAAALSVAVALCATAYAFFTHDSGDPDETNKPGETPTADRTKAPGSPESPLRPDSEDASGPTNRQTDSNQASTVEASADIGPRARQETSAVEPGPSKGPPLDRPEEIATVVASQRPGDFARYALVVGVCDYGDGDGMRYLRSPCSDAEAVTELLVGDYGYLPENVVTMTSDRHQTGKGNLKPTAANMKLEVEKFKTKYGKPKESSFLFYYSGHGNKFIGQTEGLKAAHLSPSGYRCLPAGDGDADGGTEPLSHLSWNMRRLLEDLEFNIASKHKMVILDCCYSGYGTMHKGAEEMDNYVHKHWQHPAKVVLTSSQPEQRSYEGEVDTQFDGLSAFTSYLVRGLRIEGDSPPEADTNQDGVVTDEELALYLQAKVTKGVFDVLRKNQQPALFREERDQTRRGQFLFVPSQMHQLRKSGDMQ